MFVSVKLTNRDFAAAILPSHPKHHLLSVKKRQKGAGAGTEE